jgi:hypothetical protein
VKVSVSSLGGAGCAVKIENGLIDRKRPAKVIANDYLAHMPTRVVQDIEWLAERSRLFREVPEGASRHEAVMQPQALRNRAKAYRP